MHSFRGNLIFGRKVFRKEFCHVAIFSYRVQSLRGNLIFGKKDCLGISKEFYIYIDYSVIFPSSNAIFAEEEIKIEIVEEYIVKYIYIYIF